MSTPSPLIQGHGLKKSYWMEKKETSVLKGIDLTIESHSLMAILGPSGAGKSTLLHILSSLDTPTEGQVLFKGENLFEKDEKVLSEFRNREIGFIFQFHHLLPEFSMLENVMMPLLVRGESQAESRKVSEKLLDRLGLGGRQSHRPSELSGGEQQRVAVARALVTSPSLVFADEPTGNLDHENGEKLAELFLELHREVKTAFVLVTHNADLARRFTKKIYLEDGRVVRREG